MFRVDEEVTGKLDDLDDLIQRRSSGTTDNHDKFPSHIIVKDCKRSHNAEKQMMPASQGNETAGRQQKMHGRTDQENQCEEPTPYDAKTTMAQDENSDRYGTPGHIDMAYKKQPNTYVTQQKGSTETEPYISQPKKEGDSSDGIKMDAGTFAPRISACYHCISV